MPSTPLRRAPSSSSSPPNSSPLNPNYKYHNPPSQRRASLKTQFQTQSRYIQLPQQRVHLPINPVAQLNSEETPQKVLWRERFRQKCAERSERDRVKFKSAKKRASGMSSPSDSAFDDDADMEADGLDEMDDDVHDCLRGHERVFRLLIRVLLQLYRRLVIYESQKRARISFAQAMVSSMDPDMENFEELVHEFTGPSKYRPEFPQPDIDLSDSELDYPPETYADTPFETSSDMDVDVDVGMDMSSSPASPRKPSEIHPHSRFVSLLLASPCPYCCAPFSLHGHNENGQPAVLCALCTNTLLLGDAPESWFSAHPSSLRLVSDIELLL